jgi:ABC-2 type transport system permease protein
VNSILLILLMGVFLVPSLLIEEKENKTMHALLVSPASISQVVVGKALAGWFYILVTAVMIFVISWTEVIHWEMAVLFVIAGGFFSVAVGLVLGSMFDKHQDMVGWVTALVLILVGAILVRSLGMELPVLVESLLPWVPSVALAEILRAAFSQTIDLTQVLISLGIVLVVSLLLYAFVIWKIRRSDR